MWNFADPIGAIVISIYIIVSWALTGRGEFCPVCQPPFRAVLEIILRGRWAATLSLSKGWRGNILWQVFGIKVGGVGL